MIIVTRIHNLLRSYSITSKHIEIVRTFVNLIVDNAPEFQYLIFNLLVSRVSLSLYTG